MNSPNLFEVKTSTLHISGYSGGVCSISSFTSVVYFAPGEGFSRKDPVILMPCNLH